LISVITLPKCWDLSENNLPFIPPSMIRRARNRITRILTKVFTFKCN
jgi:hypothetical protein